MKVIPTSLDGVVVIEAPVFADPRGFFTEVFHAAKFAALGLPTEWVQDNHSRSARHILRGLHFQRNQPQGKLVRAVSGSIYDVAVDLRRSSATFGRWFGITLEAGDGRQLYIPPGCRPRLPRVERARRCRVQVHYALRRPFRWRRGVERRRDRDRVATRGRTRAVRLGKGCGRAHARIDRTLRMTRELAPSPVSVVASTLENLHA